MCFYNDGECSTIWEETQPKARIEHKCSECREPIPAGTRYTQIKSLFDGHWDTFKICHKCDVWRCKIAILEIAHGCLSDYWCPVPDLFEELSQSEEYRALEPTADDLAVSLVEWKGRVTAAHVAARAVVTAGR